MRFMTEWSAITTAIGVVLSSDRERGQEVLARCWDSIDLRDAAQRCVLAHYLADLQVEVADEVAWDEAALLALADVAETDLTEIGIPRPGRSSRACA